MKRLVALALCAMMAIGLCACGDSAILLQAEPELQMMLQQL